jgi:hypothetical protein
VTGNEDEDAAGEDAAEIQISSSLALCRRDGQQVQHCYNLSRSRNGRPWAVHERQSSCYTLSAVYKVRAVDGVYDEPVQARVWHMGDTPGTAQALKSILKLYRGSTAALDPTRCIPHITEGHKCTCIRPFSVDLPELREVPDAANASALRTPPSLSSPPYSGRWVSIW